LPISEKLAVGRGGVKVGPDALDSSDTPDSIDAEPVDEASEPAEPRLFHPLIFKAFDMRCEVVSPGLSRLRDRLDFTTRIEDWFRDVRLPVEERRLPLNRPALGRSELLIRESVLKGTDKSIVKS
jgi:hypothetical protein